jgi:DNA-binding NtrC family response regulator
LLDRKDDIPQLVEYYLNAKTRVKPVKKVSPKAMEKLQSYYWPGNIRELENVIERAIILTAGDVIEPQDFVLEFACKGSGESYTTDSYARLSLSDIEKIHIERILKENDYSKKKAAGVLGISLRTLYTKIYDYQIHIPRTRGSV